jgi:two-component system chemotaxis response regulator CheB
MIVREATRFIGLIRDLGRGLIVEDTAPVAIAA